MENKVDAMVEVVISGEKKYNDPEFKDEEASVASKEVTPKLEIKEVVKNDGYVMEGNTLIKPIRLENLSKNCQQLVKENGKGWITRNSKCPCNSGKRFKSCCMELIKK